MPSYQILGRRAQLVSFPDGNDKIIPAQACFKASSDNVSVKRLLRAKPPLVRQLTDDEIPERLANEIIVLLDN